VEKDAGTVAGIPEVRSVIHPKIAEVIPGMKLEYSELDKGIRLIKLIGKLDMDGTASVDDQFVQYCAGENAFVLVDLTSVNYLSSIGVPLLVNTAKAVAEHGGRMAFINPQASVKSVLDITGVSHMIKIYKDLETAMERLISA
jgi:anti-anti-sigma factor